MQVKTPFSLLFSLALQVLFPLQYKSCCIRRHARLFSKTCLDYKTCHTIYSKTRLKYRTQQPSVDVTMTSSLLSSKKKRFKTGLEIRPVFAKLRFWVCRTLEFFAWVFEKNQGFLKKSYVNWSRILSLVNRFWIFIGISNDSFLKITLRSFLPIFRFFLFEILLNAWVLLLSYWVFSLSFEFFSSWVYFKMSNF